MIDGLKLTFSGEELRTLLDARIQQHEQRADRWTRERSRTPEEATEDEPLLPEHMCENEAERHTWRSRVLTFIRDHIESTETYRLDSAALESGELLPAIPEWLAQQEYEERTAVGFNLGRLTKSVDGLAGTATELLSRQNPPQLADEEPPADGVIEETDEFITRRLELGDGPEVIVIERK